MSEKVNLVINTILSKSDLVSDIYDSSNEYYFKFKGHNFSIMRKSEPGDTQAKYIFFVYPDCDWSPKDLGIGFERSSPDELGVKVASYPAEFLEDDIAVELYNLLRQKHLNVDAVFDDILEDQE